MAGIRQGIRIRAINRKAKYKKKFYVYQKVRTRKGVQKTKYSYGKKIIIKRKRYSYKK